MRPFAFTGDDALRLTSFNAAAGVTLSLEGRFEREDGTIQSFARAQVPNTDRTTLSTTFPMGTGRLLEVQVRASAGTPRRGQCFVIVEVVRGLTGSQVPLGALLQGYVTDTQRRGWPTSLLELSPDGPGVIRSILGTNPAAGVEISETVPTNARWRLLSFQAILITGVAAANREVNLALDDGTTDLCYVTAGQSHVASTQRTYTSYVVAARFTLAVALGASMPLPATILMGGYRIRTIVTNLQAADDWTAPQLWVEEWIED